MPKIPYSKAPLWLPFQGSCLVCQDQTEGLNRVWQQANPSPEIQGISGPPLQMEAKESGAGTVIVIDSFWRDSMAFLRKALAASAWLICLPLWTLAQHFESIPDFANQSNLTNTTGVSVADYDLDGDLDIYLVASQAFDPTDSMTWSRLLRNENGQGFTDVTLSAQVINLQAENKEGTMGAKMGASWGDYDRDGYPDLFLSNNGPDELWHNEGDGTFRNVTQEAGVAGCAFCYSANAVWWDYDKDGDLDVYVSDWLKANRMYDNTGDGTFLDISESSGLDDAGHSFSSIPIDLNDDGLLDLYVVNDIGENVCYQQLESGKFIDRTMAFGLNNHGNGMGVAICDYNLDGFFDLYVTNIHEYVPNPFFVNDSTGPFTDQAAALGIENTGWGWGARFFDTDHDMDEDLYVVNGFDSPIAEGDRNHFFRYQNGRFEDVSEEVGLNDIAWGMGLEAFDYDLDGDLDMVVGNREAASVLYSNQSTQKEGKHNWLQISLIGTKSNPHGWGAKVQFSCGQFQQYRYHSGVNLFGQSIQPLHVGLGDHDQVDQIMISWPSGLEEVFGPFAANQFLSLQEGQGLPLSPPLQFGSAEIFPNPFQQQLWIQAAGQEPEEIHLSLVDQLGRLVFDQGYSMSAEQQLIPLFPDNFQLEAGIYIYHIQQHGHTRTGKLLKQ